MHVSLDSALGRQRRLNSVGESVLQIAPNAAAAYSLRSLTGGDPTVVRVRRGSDNHEQDFTASQVSAGALTSFVNAQVVAPLDIQALEADGRTGDFLIAKAAYSLRSLGTRQATLAATGDTVARADGKFVAQVRRSSDDALKSFTAAEITDGTLLAFVNAIPTLDVASNFTLSGQSYETFTNASNSGFSITNSDTGARGGFGGVTGISGDVLSVSFDLNIISGSPRMILSEYNTTNTRSNAIVYDSSGSYTAILTATGDFNFITFTEGDIPAEWTISNFKITAIQSSGLVKTWYDQSVTNEAGDTATGNHATQATAGSQPKIVSAGSLLTAGVTFDGTDDSLSVSGEPVITASSSGTYSAFSVQTASNSESGYLYGNAAPSNGSSLYAGGSNFTLTNRNTAAMDSIPKTSSQNLLSAVYNNGDAGLLVNGAGTMTDAGTYNFSAGSSDFVIGNRNEGTSVGTFLTGSINEIVIYNSNQSANRTAIEANIGEVYSIDLPSGVDPGFDQVDGFVETWYDQSGNGRDATQSVAGSQPKIVDAGVLVSGGLDFDGSDDFLTNGTAIMNNAANAYASVVLSRTSTTSNEIPLSFPADFTGNRGFDLRLSSGTTSQLSIRTSAGSSNASGSFATASGSNVLLTGTFNAGLSSDEAKFFGNGSLVGSASNSGSGLINNGDNGGLFIGRFGSPTNFGAHLNGKVEEVIVYTSDQTANRVALETNINSEYSIF